MSLRIKSPHQPNLQNSSKTQGIVQFMQAKVRLLSTNLIMKPKEMNEKTASSPENCDKSQEPIWLIVMIMTRK